MSSLLTKEEKSLIPIHLPKELTNDITGNLLNMQPGDIFCSSNPMALGTMINFHQKLWATDGESVYSHAGIIVSHGGMTIESDHRVEQFCLLDKYMGAKVLIARWTEITDEKYIMGMKGINCHIGDMYPYHRLVLHLMRLSNVIHWRRVVCSELVAKFLYKMGARHSHYFGTNPDTLADEIVGKLNTKRSGPKYRIIFDGKLPILFYKTCTACDRTIKEPQMIATTCPYCHNGLMSICAQNMPKKFADKNIDLIKKYNEQKFVD